MSAILESYGLAELSEEQKRTLAQALLESVEPRHTPRLSPELLQELRRRIAEEEADPDSSIPWEDVKARLEKRFGI